MTAALFSLAGVGLGLHGNGSDGAGASTDANDGAATASGQRGEMSYCAGNGRNRRTWVFGYFSNEVIGCIKLSPPPLRWTYEVVIGGEQAQEQAIYRGYTTRSAAKTEFPLAMAMAMGFLHTSKYVNV